MRVLQVTNADPIQIGGAESVVANLSRSLMKKGVAVSIVFPDEQSVSLTKSSVEKVDLLHVPSIGINSRLIFPRARALLQLVKILRSFDVIHVISPYDSFTMTVSILAFLVRKPMLLSIWGYLGLIHHTSRLVRIFGFPFELLVSVFAGLSDVVQCCNVEEYARLRKINKRTLCIPNGISPEFLEKGKGQGVVEKLGLGGKKNVLFVGRLHIHKGPQILVESMKYVVAEDRQVTALIVGPDQGLGERLKKRIEHLGLIGHVRILGPIANEDLVELYDAADLVVIPSICLENFSIVLSEAWARQKWVVASRIGALKYRINDGVDGYLVAAADPVGLSEKILMALRNRKPFRLPEDVCSWDSVSERYLKLYETLATEGPLMAQS